MKIKSRNFPHPVLHPTMDDIIKSHFIAELTNQTLQNTIIKFDVRFKVKNDTLNALIQNGSVQLTVHFECASTLQRIAYQIKVSDCTVTSTKKEVIYETSLSIDSTLLNKKIDINYFILASKGIPDYTNSDMHEDFAGLSFNIEKGDILAVAITQTLHLEKEPLVKTNSIFNIVIDDDLPPFSIGMNRDQIEVSFPKEIHEKIKSYNELYGDQANKILIQMVYYPVLLHTLYIIESTKAESDDLSDYENLDWYITLEKKLSSLGKAINELNNEDIPALSYSILNEDIMTPWLDLENILNDIGVDEDEQ